MAGILPLFAGSLGAAEGMYSSLPQSEALEGFERRPESELSKLLFLIDRLKETGFYVIFEGQRFDSIFAARMARWYLSRNYEGEKAMEWVRRHVTRSPVSGRPIYVEEADGDLHQAQKMLIRELAQLEASAAAVM